MLTKPFMEKDELIQIDLQQVLDTKLGSRSRFVPRWLVDKLKSIIRQDDLNTLLRVNYPHKGAEFCQGVLDHLDVKVSVVNSEKLPSVDEKRFIAVCNHPLGGLDGMALIKIFTDIYGQGVKFVVNDMLMAVAPLRNVFLPINKHGHQDRKAIADINEAMAGDAPVVIFPAGLVSRRGKDGKICDLDWNKMFVNKAIEFHRPVLPIYFSGHNSPFFYKFAQWRKRLGIKLNIEMVCLPAEVFKSRGKSYEVIIGDTIPWETLHPGKRALENAREIKNTVYSLCPESR